ncbi:MAG: response regulator [Gemmatimonadales bacterium]|nr:response regulator [Gemmatimonadales bacterium]
MAKRILVVEDSPTQAEVLRADLEGAGYEVEVAASGEEGVARFDPQRFHVVISDIVMPGAVDGYELCRRIKAGTGRQTPVILLTSLADPLDIINGLECGADNFLTKPHQLEHLLERLQLLLATRQARTLGRLQVGVDVFFLGRKFTISSEREQILDLLISTFEDAVLQNRALRQREGELEAARAELARYAGTLQARMAGVLDMAQDAIISVDESQHIVLFNRGAEQMFGYAAREVLGQPLDALLPSGVADVHRGHIRGFAAAPETGRRMGERSEVRGRRKDGTEFPAEASISKLVRDGETIFTAIVRDVTERWRAEEELALGLREREAIMEGVPDILYLLDADARLVRWNRRFEVATGYAPEELAGRAALDFFRADAQPLVAAKIMEAFQTGYAEVEADLLAKDGRTVPHHWSGVPRRDERGEAVGLVGVGRDLTAYKKLEHQFRQAQKMEAVGRLAGGIAHDFNNVLTAISGYTELLIEEAAPQDPRRGDLEEIRTAAERAAGLTRQLLAFSRQQVLEPRVLDLNAVVAGMDKMLRRILGEDVELAAALAARLGRIKADPGQIEQVILNLAVNARDAMPGGGKLTIETADVELDDAYAGEHVAVVPGPYVMLAVSDTGTGMDAETKAKIFEPFFTTKGPGKGTGLGLATVYGIVKQSGGNLWVYSEPGQGATFKVYLPRVDEPAERPAAAAAPARPIAGTETILVVEDNESVRRLVRTVLSGHGYTVLEAAEPAEALALVGRHGGEIALLVTDVVMPGMSGRELAQQVEAVRPDLLVLYMSGYTDDAIVNHGVLEAGVAFLQKPFTPAGLLRKVREVLDGA